MNIKNASDNKKDSIGPDIWLAGDPEDLTKWMDKGVKGIVTNTVVLKEMTDKYGSIIELTKRYLDITDKKVAIEIDGHSTNELLDVGEAFTKLSDRVILKIPMSVHALGAFAELKKAKETDIIEMQQAMQNYSLVFNNELTKREQQLEYELVQKYKKAVDSVATKQGYTIVIDGSAATLYVNPKLNITDDVLYELRKLNEENSSTE